MRPSLVEAGYALALHTFTPGEISPTCLSFRAGQVISILTKDDSGWWDGTVDGKRGWFPSNFVEVCSVEQATIAAEEDEAAEIASSRGDVSRQSIPTSRSTSPFDENSFRASNYASTSSRSSATSVLDGIQEAIGVLQTAILTNRIAHFQPSTASVISSVRLVLSSTSSLTRESPVLQKHPSLALARKRILSCLAALVNQARRASSPAIDEEERAVEKKLMVKMSKNVWDGVQSFLVLADKYDIWLSPAEMLRSEEQESIRSVAGGAASPSRRSPTKSTTSIPATTNSSNSLSTLSARHRRSFVVHSTAELSEIIALIHDQLSSTIVTFIAHIHAHTRTSRSSSYAQLIDMTRDTIAKVREVLVVVEAVIKSPSLMHASTRAVEVKTLKGHREVLHAATTALVTAARIATSERAEPVEEEEERSTLLKTATAVLQAAGECVGVVKKCITRRDSGLGLFELSLPNLDRPVSSLSSPFPDYHSNPSSPSSITTRSNPLESKSPPRAQTPQKVRSPAASISSTTEISAAVFAMMDMEDTDDVAEELPPNLSPRQSPSLNHRSQPSDSSDFRFDPQASSSSHVATSKSSSLNGIPSNQQVFPSSALNSSFGSGRPIIHSRTSSRASSSRGDKQRIASVPMSRNESSRTSESVASSRSAVSVSTNETSPRSSASLNTDAACPSDEATSFPSRRPSETYSPSLAFSAFRSPDAVSAVRPAGATVWYLERDYLAKEVSFNCDGHVTGATLPALIERMTLHDTTIDPTFANTFFLTFRMFTTPTKLSEALYARYDLQPPSLEMLPEQVQEWTTIKATPVRLRIFNLFKTWLESHWQPETDAIIAPSLLEFCQDQLSVTMASASLRLVDLVHKRMENNSLLRPRLGESRSKSSEQMKAGRIVGFGDPYSSTSSLLLNGPTAPPSIVTKNLLQQIRSSSTAFVNVTEIDPLELARQLTIMESRLFCSIKSDELLSQEKSSAANVRAMSSLSTRLAGWIVALILNERDPKKRTSLVKYFIKLSDRCLTLDNYNTLMAVLCALNSSTISRLRRTWDGVSGKYRLILEQLRKCTEHTRNYAEYRSRIREALPPCLPFLGLYLTDITFCYEGNQAERASPLDSSLKLINFDRYQKMARIVSDVQRFQTPYNLIEIPEIQSFLDGALQEPADDVASTPGALYRLSLKLEPREEAVDWHSTSNPPIPKHELFHWV